jgi:ABC-type Fe3+-hydroxamate transport system substrate-binding protein
MRIYAMLAGMLLTLLAVCAYAHGDKIHIRGTLTNVTATTVTVKGADGKPVDVKLVKSTIYTLRSNNADQPAKASDLAIGDIVVVHATQGDSGLEADEIKFSVPIKTPATKTSGSLS